ncbi:MAG: hypothetical protein IPK82_20060 [Polyangiaceae bacterium]|nr:hypothetical protein [Polyangiaceae bacterium]
MGSSPTLVVLFTGLAALGCTGGLAIPIDAHQFAVNLLAEDQCRPSVAAVEEVFLQSIPQSLVLLEGATEAQSDDLRLALLTRTYWIFGLLARHHRQDGWGRAHSRGFELARKQVASWDASLERALMESGVIEECPQIIEKRRRGARSALEAWTAKHDLTSARASTLLSLALHQLVLVESRFDTTCPGLGSVIGILEALRRGSGGTEPFAGPPFCKHERGLVEISLALAMKAAENRDWRPPSDVRQMFDLGMILLNSPERQSWPEFLWDQMDGGVITRIRAKEMLIALEREARTPLSPFQLTMTRFAIKYYGELAQ